MDLIQAARDLTARGLLPAEVGDRLRESFPDAPTSALAVAVLRATEEAVALHRGAGRDRGVRRARDR